MQTDAPRPVLLSLFRGIGLLDRAFEDVFPDATIVCGPDLIWGGDVRRFHVPVGVFDGVFGGPPCQRFSKMATLVRHVYGEEKLAQNLIPDFERVVTESRPRWFLMENVPAAPLPVVLGYTVSQILINNRWIGDGVGQAQNRLRRFSFGVRGDTPVQLDVSSDLALWANPVYVPAVLASGTTWSRSRAGPAGTVSRAFLEESIAAQGLDSGFLANAPFTVAGQVRMVNNGVPLPMGRAVARAVRRAMGYDDAE